MVICEEGVVIEKIITVGGTTLVLVVLGDVRKNVEQVMSRQTCRQHSSLASVALPASKFLP